MKRQDGAVGQPEVQRVGVRIFKAALITRVRSLSGCSTVIIRARSILCDGRAPRAFWAAPLPTTATFGRRRASAARRW